MKVFVAGASGRVGQEVVMRLAARGYEVLAASRSAESRQWPAGVVGRNLDFHADVETLSEQVRGSDAVVFTASSRGKDLLQTDAFGAVKLMKAAAAVGANRFIMLSSLLAAAREMGVRGVAEAHHRLQHRQVLRRRVADSTLRPGLDPGAAERIEGRARNGTHRVVPRTRRKHPHPRRR